MRDFKASVQDKVKTKGVDMKKYYKRQNQEYNNGTVNMELETCIKYSISPVDKRNANRSYIRKIH